MAELSTTSRLRRSFRLDVNSRLALLAGQACIAGAVLLAWQLSSGPVLSPLWFSSPVQVAESLWRLTIDGTLWFHLQATLLTVVIGYGLGSLFGIICGFALGFMPRVEAVLSPLISTFWCLPKIALLPLFVIFFGIGIGSKVALVMTVVVFLVLYSTIDGVRDIDRDYVDSLILMGAKRDEILLKVMVPATLPWIYTGMRVSIGYALTTTVVGELLSSNRGLGFLMESAAAQFDASTVFAAVTVLVIINLLVVRILTGVEARSSRWRL